MQRCLCDQSFNIELFRDNIQFSRPSLVVLCLESPAWERYPHYILHFESIQFLDDVSFSFWSRTWLGFVLQLQQMYRILRFHASMSLFETMMIGMVITICDFGENVYPAMSLFTSDVVHQMHLDYFDCPLGIISLHRIFSNKNESPLLSLEKSIDLLINEFASFIDAHARMFHTSPKYLFASHLTQCFCPAIFRHDVYD